MSNLPSFEQQLEKYGIDPRDVPQPGEKYDHYKGGKYEIIMNTLCSETLEPRVIYKSLIYPGVPWNRPLTVFLSKQSNGDPRFVRVHDPKSFRGEF